MGPLRSFLQHSDTSCAKIVSYVVSDRELNLSMVGLVEIAKQLSLKDTPPPAYN